MGMIKEFKAFAMRGNVIDLAVGIVIGAGFGKIVSSLVNDIIMPPIGKLMGGADFSQLKYIIQEASVSPTGEPIAPVSINYGNFLQTLLDFIIVAFAIFMVIKAMNKMKKKKEEAPVTPSAPPAQEVLLTEIRDLLKK